MSMFYAEMFWVVLAYAIVVTLMWLWAERSVQELIDLGRELNARLKECDPEWSAPVPSPGEQQQGQQKGGE